MTRLVVAGAGWAGAVHVATGGRSVSHVLSRTTESAERLAAQVTAAAGTYAELSSKADAVIVASPPEHHAPFALDALARSLAVLIEKPLCAKLTEADQLASAAESSGLLTGYAENLLFAPAVEAALAHRSTLGPLRHLSIRTLQPPPDWGHFLEPLTDGGALFDLGAHATALALALAGSEPVGVSAALSSSRADGADDLASVRLRFADGLVAEIEVSWLSAEATWDVQAAADEGVVRIELLPEVRLELDGDEIALVDTDPLVAMGYRGQVDGFLAALEGRGGRVCPLGFGRLVLEVTSAAYLSAGTGGEVSLPYEGPRDLTPLQLWLG